MTTPRCMHCHRTEAQHDDRRCGGEFMLSAEDEIFDVLTELYEVMADADLLDDDELYEPYDYEWDWEDDGYDRGELGRGDIVVA